LQPARAYPPAQDYNTGQGFGPPQNYNTGQQFQPAPAYPPAQDYNTGQGFGPPQNYNTGQGFQPGPGHPPAAPAQGFDRGQGQAPAPRSQPGPGYPPAGNYPSGRGPQAPRPQGARGNRRLYAVPDSPTPGMDQGMGMGPGGGQMVQYSGAQALALAEPDWQDDPQEALGTMPGPVIAPPRPRTAPARPRTAPPRTRPNAPAARPAGPRTAPARSARPAGLAGPRTAPAKKQGGARGRQSQAFRIAAAGTATLFAVTILAAGAEIGTHGFRFFTFREAGAGETGGTQTDQDFLAQQAAAAKAAAQGHTPGKHSAKTTSG
jgi:hypothetical protein